MGSEPVRKPRRLIAAGIVAAVATLAATLVGAFVFPSAATAGPLGGAVVGPPGDAFYTPPSPLPAGNPGDVIWYRAAKATALFKPPAGTTIYQVLYLSSDARGRPDAVSGTVYLPKSRASATTPIIGFAPGTVGLADTCAPSRQLTASGGSDYNQIAVSAQLNRGWAVAETDYQGLGTPGEHTYVVGRSEGHAVIDAVRAATRLAQTGLSSTAPVAFYGYSQGGGGAAWAGELQPRYAPEMPLKAVSAGGTPADLIKVAAKLDGGPGFALEAAAALGFDAAYPELKLDSYLNASGKKALANVDTLCVVGMIAAYAYHKISEYTTSNPLVNPVWIARLNENKLGQSPPKVPIYLYHSKGDELVDVGQAVALRDAYCAAGVNVTWKQLTGEHVTGAFAGQSGAIGYLADRFAGKAPASTCGQA